MQSSRGEKECTDAHFVLLKGNDFAKSFPLRVTYLKIFLFLGEVGQSEGDEDEAGGDVAEAYEVHGGEAHDEVFGSAE